MLTPDLVRARRRDGELVLSPLTGARRRRAVELADTLLAAARDSVGLRRAELDDAWSELLPRSGSERKLIGALQKLIEDRSTFESQTSVPPEDVRRAVFLRAAELRRTGELDESNVRQQALADAAATLSLGVSDVEELLFADLRAAHRLVAVPNVDGALLVAELGLAEQQAVLLRAEALTVRVRCRRALGYRALFRALKFRRLLYRLEALPDDGYSLQIDGPLSLFSAGTRYGLELALLLPALLACDEVELSAALRWGARRERLVHRWAHRRARADAADEAPLDDVARLEEQFRRRATRWTVAPSAAVLDVPGLGVCVPDLEFRHPELAEPVHFELLGYWSRDAVFARVALVERGLGAEVVFGVSQKLRVSEEVLGDDLPARLYVFRGAPSAAGLERHLEALRRRRVASPSPP